LLEKDMRIPPKLKEMASTLIATPSVSSALPQFDQTNRQVVDSLAAWLEDLGFNITVSPIAGHPGKSNLMATMGSGSGGLVLSGHTDTVPFDEHLWQTNPFQLTERDDRWYGLGACDMKSFFALVIEAVKPLAKERFRHPLTVLATADEESSMSGARALTRDAIANARFAVIGEPTGLRPVRRHKGIMMLSLTMTGSSGHSSNPDLGASALDGMADVLDQMMAFRSGLAQHHRDASFEVASPTMNLGCIHGGDNPNRICDHVNLAFDVRVLPGMDNGEVMDALKQELAAHVPEGLTLDLNLLFPWVQPFESSGNELVSTLQGLSGNAPASVAFATEAPFLTALDVETVVMGPGSIDQAHQPNEFVELSQLEPAIAIIRGLVEKYCL